MDLGHTLQQQLARAFRQSIEGPSVDCQVSQVGAKGAWSPGCVCVWGSRGRLGASSRQAQLAPEMLSGLGHYPRYKSIPSLRGRQVQAQHVGPVPVEALQQLPALHIPQRACSVPTGRQDLPRERRGSG